MEASTANHRSSTLFCLGVSCVIQEYGRTSKAVQHARGRMSQQDNKRLFDCEAEERSDEASYYSQVLWRSSEKPDWLSLVVLRCDRSRDDHHLCDLRLPLRTPASLRTPALSTSLRLSTSILEVCLTIAC
jgi:hypothetical protein